MVPGLGVGPNSQLPIAVVANVCVNIILVTDVTPLRVKIEGASRMVESCVAWMTETGAPPPAATCDRTAGVRNVRMARRGMRSCMFAVCGLLRGGGMRRKGGLARL